MRESGPDGPIDWKITKTDFWIIKSYLHPSGETYVEQTSRMAFGDWPLIHTTYGRHPETGRRKTARGIIALGRFAKGVFPIGQVAWGVFPVGQASFGLVFALGQAAIGWVSLGQIALAWQLAVGQLAVAKNAIGQLAVGEYCMGQAAVGEHIYTPRKKDPKTLEHFRKLLPILRQLKAG